MKEIAVLGSTGSIGKQTLDVIRAHPERFHASVIAAKTNIEMLEEQAMEFQPNAIVITDEEAGKRFREIYNGKADIFCGEKALAKIVARDDVDTVLVAVTGIAGLEPALAAIEAGKEIALANKETLVAGGELVMEAARRKGTNIIPVDSEHSAIFQSLLGQDKKAVHNLILTASGGPFRGKKKEELKHVTLEDAMKHPTWSMGRKVTLDSATMFNKGLEVIEAHWLFNVDYNHIKVLIQPQSLIHSMVEYEDGSIIAQIGNPDMRLPIQFALTYPERIFSPSREFVDWTQIMSVAIEQPDTDTFRSLRLAYEAGKTGGNATTVFNAANEEAISGFINGQISFLEIFDVVEETLNRNVFYEIHSLEDLRQADLTARKTAGQIINKGYSC